MTKKTERSEPVSAPRSFRGYHATILAAIGLLVAAHSWLGREMLARSCFNLLRYPPLAQQSQWARMTQWLPGGLSQNLSRAVVGSLPTLPPSAAGESVDRLHRAADVFPYDGILQLELSRNLYDQARRLGTRQATQALELLDQALEHNQRAFDTYFNVKAYSQRAWIYTELHALQLATKRTPEAAASLRTAIEGFHRVLRLSPADLDALEHLAWIHSSIASASKRREDWLVALDFAKRLLEAQPDNTNALYFLGIAYENLELRDRAVTYYMKTLTSPSTLPPDKRMWDRKVILDHLVAAGYTLPIPPEKPSPSK